MRTWMTAIIVAVMVLVPLGIMGTASAAGTTRDLTTVVIGPVPTDRFGGGDLVAVKAGDALFGVRYGSNAHANDIVIFATRSPPPNRSEEHTSELQSLRHLVCRLLVAKKKKKYKTK